MAAVVIHFHFLVVQFFALVLVVLNFQVFADDLWLWSKVFVFSLLAFSFDAAEKWVGFGSKNSMHLWNELRVRLNKFNFTNPLCCNEVFCLLYLECQIIYYITYLHFLQRMYLMPFSDFQTWSPEILTKIMLPKEALKLIPQRGLFSDLKFFANSQVGQNNFGNKIPFLPKAFITAKKKTIS